MRTGNEKRSLPKLVLNLDKVLPGDVLCTQGAGKESKAIALLSGGQFSHASLLVDRYLLYESDGDLVRNKALAIFGWHPLEGKQIPLAAIPGDPCHAMVFRHPAIASRRQDFQQAVKDEMQVSFGQNYSEMNRLVRLAHLPSAARWILDRYYRIKHRRQFANDVPGPFCSELVARVYARLQLPLFDYDVQPEDVSPNTLANSKLWSVDEAILSTAGLSIVPIEPQYAENKASALYSAFAGYRNMQRKDERSLRRVSETMASVRSGAELIVSEAVPQFDALLEKVDQHLELCSNIGSAGVRRRALRLGRIWQRLALEFATFDDLDKDDCRRREILRNLSSGTRSLLRCRHLLLSKLIKDQEKRCLRFVRTLRKGIVRRRRLRVLQQFRREVQSELRFNRIWDEIINKMPSTRI